MLIECAALFWIKIKLFYKASLSAIFCIVLNSKQPPAKTFTQEEELMSFVYSRNIRGKYGTLR